MSRLTRYSYAALLLYPDCAAHKSIIDILEGDSNPTGFKFCYIYHDRDSDPETGEVKKTHVHVFVKFPYAISERSIRSVFEQYGLDARFLQIVECPIGFGQYLTHSDPKSLSLGKYQYALTDVRGDLSLILDEGTRQSTDVGTLIELLEEYRDTLDYPRTWIGVIKFLNDHDAVSIVTKLGFIATKMIYEVLASKDTKYSKGVDPYEEWRN